MSTTDGAILIKTFFYLFKIDILLSNTEKNYANETFAMNKILFITFRHKSKHN